MAEFQKKFVIVNSKGEKQELSIYTSPEEAMPYGKTFIIEYEGMSGYIGLTNDFSLENVSDMYVIIDNIEYRAFKTKLEKVFVLTLKAYRNNETFICDLPNLVFYGENKKFYLNNENAPTIDGYDFVCCENNNSVVDENKEIKVYYIPNSIPNREKNDWHEGFKTATGDLYLQDFVNTFNAASVGWMFASSTIESLPKMNFSNVTNMIAFLSSSKIKKVDFKLLDTSNCNSFAYLCSYAQQLEEADLSTLNTEKVETASYLFTLAGKLHTLNVNGWNTKNFTTLNNAFSYCSSLRILDLSSWDTSKVKDMYFLLFNCTSLTEVKGTLDLSSCTNITDAFTNLNSLEYPIKLKNVPKSLDLLSSGGIENITYIIENYLDL